MDAKVDHAINNNSRLRSISRVNSPLTVAIACREDALTVRNRLRLESGAQAYLDQQNRTRCVKKSSMTPSSLAVGHSNQASTAVSRRNARERKRVRLVNLGFATLRDHVPAGTKTKKLSKVETLRAAISYIRQLQDILGERECDDYQDMSPELHDDTQENYMSPQSVLLQEDNSSASEEMMVELMAIAPMSNGKAMNNDAGMCSSSPASSTEGSLVASYDESPLLDIGAWFT